MRCGFSEYIIELLEEIPGGVTLLEVQYCFLSMMLKKHDGNRTHAAKEAGISLTSLKRRVREMETHGYPVEQSKYHGYPAEQFE